MSYMNKFFHKISISASQLLGSPIAFIIACILTVVWLIAGPFMHFSNAWNFLANSSTTVAVFLSMFLLQHSQNRHAKEIELKIDELIIRLPQPRNKIVKVKDLSDDELEEIHKELEEKAND